MLAHERDRIEEADDREHNGAVEIKNTQIAGA